MLTSAMIVEDNLRDARDAQEVLTQLGTEQIELISVFGTARLAFEDMCSGARPAPGLVILDLDMGRDSGFELLRLWKSNHGRFTRTRLIVWTNMPELERQIAQMFGVEVVSKKHGVAELKRVLSTAMPPEPKAFPATASRPLNPKRGDESA